MDRSNKALQAVHKNMDIFSYGAYYKMNDTQVEPIPSYLKSFSINLVTQPVPSHQLISLIPRPVNISDLSFNL